MSGPLSGEGGVTRARPEPAQILAQKRERRRPICDSGSFTGRSQHLRSATCGISAGCDSN
eukprot:5855021-Alexandrium_andersonii.AAC.1